MKKVVIVTGGSRGIGAATSKLLASKGYSVCVNYRSNEEQANTVVSEIKQTGGVAFSFKADVSIEDEVKMLFTTVSQRLGPVTDLVNNAGILFTQSKLSNISFSRFNEVISANIGSCFLCSKEFIAQPINSGAIVNVSSAASRSGAPCDDLQ